jgi:hypothetical protein
MPIELKLVLFDREARRSFSNTIKRCRPAFLDLQARIASLSLAGDKLAEIIGFFVDNSLTWIEAFDRGLPASLTFNAGYGMDREFRKTADQDFLKVLGSQFIAALQSSALMQPTREAISQTIRSWLDDLPRHFLKPDVEAQKNEAPDAF